MSKIQDWEYDDVIHNYHQWQEELEKLLADEEPDKEAIEEVKIIIANYESIIFD